VALPESAENQFRQNKPWKIVKGSQIMGGHCIILIGYDSKYYYAVTWGQVVKIERTWLFKYMDEAYPIISKDYLLNDKTVAGFNMTQLQQDLKLIA
jgi:hypothetical protein